MEQRESINLSAKELVEKFTNSEGWQQHSERDEMFRSFGNFRLSVRATDTVAPWVDIALMYIVGTYTCLEMNQVFWHSFFPQTVLHESLEEMGLVDLYNEKELEAWCKKHLTDLITHLVQDLGGSDEDDK